MNSNWNKAFAKINLKANNIREKEKRIMIDYDKGMSIEDIKNKHNVSVKFVRLVIKNRK